MKGINKTATIIAVDDYSQIKNLGDNTIVITATQSLKRNKLLNSVETTMSFADLMSMAQKNIDYKKLI